MPTKDLSHLSLMLTMSAAAAACWTQKLTLVSLADQSLIVWHGKKLRKY